VKPASARNEAFDARVYALAALHGLKAAGLDLERAAERAMHDPDAASAPVLRPRPRVAPSLWMQANGF
jgi:phage terminase large subunit GpA-like protein